MTLQRIKFICLCLIGLFATHLQAEEALFNQEYEAYQSQLQSNPQLVLDELLVKIETADTNTKAHYHLLISEAYYALVFADKALHHALQGLEKLNPDKHPLLYHRLQLAMAMAHDIAGNSSKGLQAVNQVLKWANLNHNESLKIQAMTTSGYLQISLGDYMTALQLLQQAYQLAQSNDNYDQEVIAGAIALVYEYRRESELSIPFFEEVSKYHRKNNNNLELSIALYGLGKAHMYTGAVQLGLKELQESAELSRKVDDSQGQGYALKELAGYYLRQDDFERAEVLLSKSLKAFELANNSLMLFDTHKVYADLFLKTKQIKKAQTHFEQARSYIDKEKHPNQYIALVNLQAEILAFQDDYKAAFELLKENQKQKNRLTSQQSTQMLHQMRANFELLSKETENTILSQQLELKNNKLTIQSQLHKQLQLYLFFAISFIGFLSFITYGLRKNKQRFEYLANYDSLTGVFSRAKLQDELDKAFQYAAEKHQTMYIGMLDLDYFKNINDQFGHAIGDKVLTQFGACLIELNDENTICGRFGGEEFIFGITNSNHKLAKQKFEQVRKKTEKMHTLFNLKGLEITLSIGFCSNLQHKSVDDMIKVADDALYQAKTAGRNQIVVAAGE